MLLKRQLKEKTADITVDFSSQFLKGSSSFLLQLHTWEAFELEVENGPLKFHLSML